MTRSGYLEIMRIKARKLLPSLFCLAYVGLACYKISSPGVQYDELLFVNAASAERVDNAFIFREIYGVPVLLMTYIGALKSYIYYPIFKLVGVTVWSIRLPAILVTVLSLLLIHKITIKIFALPIATLSLFFLVIDPSFIFYTKLDVGPNVLELFLKTASIFLFYRYFVEKKSWSNLLFGLILLGLGLFNKLNFIWFINAFYGALIIINAKKIRQHFIDKDFGNLHAYLMVAVAYFVYLGYFFLVLFTFNLEDKVQININLHAEVVITNINALFDGSSFYNYIYGEIRQMFATSYIWYLYSAVILIGLMVNVTGRHEFIIKHKRWYLYIWLFLFFELIQIFATSTAIAPWHVFTLYPFFTILIAYSMYSACLVIFKDNRTKRLILVISIIVAISIHQAFTMEQYFRILGKPTRDIAWSGKIYDLIAFTKNRDEKFVTVDWGLHNALIAFDHKKDKYYEIAYFLSKKLSVNEEEYIDKSFLSAAGILFIAHPEGRQVFPGYRESFNKLILQRNLVVHKEKVFYDESGTIYEIFSLHQAAGNE
jgi:4-amino-4-deoxy-L-arabinose transferase-like glycosyltransferase